MTAPAIPAGVGTSTRIRRRHRSRTLVVCLGLAAACLLVALGSLAVGRVAFPPEEVVRALAGGGDGSGYIVRTVRLPRALVALLAGGALGLSGAIFQSLVRNPLASPDIIGITAGASAAAAIAMLQFGLAGYAVSAAAFTGALAVAVAIYALAWRQGVTGYRLVLVGVAMAAIMTSLVSYLLTRADVYSARDALVWLTGSLNAKTWTTVQILASCLAALFPLAVAAGRRLPVLRLGDDVARALGVPAERSRLALILVAVALAAVAVAATGPVAFVALLAGPIARRMVGGGTTGLVPAALVGALVMVAADTVAENAFGSLRFPVGVVTALIGAPYLLWLLAAANRDGNVE